MERELDLPRVRGMLAAQHISHKTLAEASKLSREHLCRVLNGLPCGELARIKIRRGLERLGVDREVYSHAS